MGWKLMLKSKLLLNAAYNDYAQYLIIKR